MLSIDVEENVTVYLRNYQAGSLRKMRSAFRTIAKDLEQYAKANAPWEDRTGMARMSLSGKMSGARGDYAATLSHGVPYGVYLERSNTGRFAILRPTVDALFPSILSNVQNAWETK